MSVDFSSSFPNVASYSAVYFSDMLPVQCVESISCGSQRHLQCMACALMQHENVLKACEKLTLDSNQHVT